MSHSTGMAIELDSTHYPYVDGVPSHGPGGVFGQFQLVGTGATGGLGQVPPPQLPLPRAPSTTSSSSSSAAPISAACANKQISSSTHSTVSAAVGAGPTQLLLTWDEYGAFRQFNSTPPSSLVAVGAADHLTSPCPPRNRTARPASKNTDMTMEIEVELAFGVDLFADDDDASSESSDGSDDSGDEDGVDMQGATQLQRYHSQPKNLGRPRQRASSMPPSLRAAIDIPTFALVPSAAYRKFEDLQSGGGGTGVAAARVAAPTCHNNNQNSTARAASTVTTNTTTIIPVAPPTLSAWDNNRAALGMARTSPVPTVSGRKRDNAALTTGTSTTTAGSPFTARTSSRSVSSVSYQQKRRRSLRYGGGFNRRGDEHENIQQTLWN